MLCIYYVSIFITLLLDHKILMKFTCIVSKLNEALIYDAHRCEHDNYYK